MPELVPWGPSGDGTELPLQPGDDVRLDDGEVHRLLLAATTASIFALAVRACVEHGTIGIGEDWDGAVDSANSAAEIGYSS